MPQKILIVEDNYLNRKLFEDILKANGYETVSTESGFQAPRLAITEKPHLVLMDIQLPEISGIDVMKMFKNNPQLKNIPVIAVTAFAMKGDEVRIMASGAAAYLPKPVSFSDLTSTVRKHINPEHPAEENPEEQTQIKDGTHQ